MYTTAFAVILSGIYTYLYLTLPNLKEHFENMQEQKQEQEQMQDEELLKKVQKGRIEENQINQQLQYKRAELKQKQDATKHTFSESVLLEYDLEKLKAIYLKFHSELKALQTYYTSLQKEYVQSGEDLNRLRVTNSENKAQCTTLGTQMIKLKNDYETALKEQKANEIIETQLKKQLSLITDKSNPLVKTIQATLNERQLQKKALDKKVTEASTKLKIEYDTLNDLKMLLSKNEEKYKSVQAQHNLIEQQIVKTNSKLSQDTKQKQNYEFELTQLKQSINNYDRMNTRTQKDIVGLYNSYNATSKTNGEKTNRISKLQAENISTTAEIKQLQETINKIKTECSKTSPPT
jgi:chromosome segregation ATPase